MEEIIKRYLRKIYYNLKTCALWLFMAVLTGVAVGAFSSAFSFCLKKVTTLRGQYPFLLYFLPIGGVVIVFLYHLCGVRQDKGLLYMEKIRMCLHIWLHLSLQQQLSLTYSVALPDVRERLSRWEEVLEIQSDGFSNLTRGIESFLS